MNELLLPLASNAAFALLLGVAALYVWRRRGWPLLAHALALLGLLKLLTPPLLGPALSWSEPTTQAIALTSTELLALLQDPAKVAARSGVGAASLPSVEEVLLGIWALGSVAMGLLAWHRHRRMGRLLDRLDAAPAVVLEQTAQLAAALGLRQAPRVGLTSGQISPFVYAMGRRPTVVLPAELVEDHRALRTVLAHELAHLAGRDHLVRWLELVVSVLHWWNPAAHLLRATLREVEEVRCDLRAVEALGTTPKRYGRVLLDTAERFETPAMPLGAHALGGGHPLSRRLIALAGGGLRSRFGHAGRLTMLVFTAAALPLGAREAEVAATEEEVEFVVETTFDIDVDEDEAIALAWRDVESLHLDLETSDREIDATAEVLEFVDAAEINSELRKALGHLRVLGHFAAGNGDQEHPAEEPSQPEKRFHTLRRLLIEDGDGPARFEVVVERADGEDRPATDREELRKAVGKHLESVIVLDSKRLRELIDGDSPPSKLPRVLVGSSTGPVPLDLTDLDLADLDLGDLDLGDLQLLASEVVIGKLNRAGVVVPGLDLATFLSDDDRQAVRIAIDARRRQGD